MSKRRDEGNVRILGIHGEARDGMRVAQANQLPGFPRVDRLVNTVTADDVATNTSFSGSDIDDIRVRFGNRDCPNRWRPIFLLVENWFPVEAAIGCLPHASGDGAKIIDIILADDARHRDHAPATKWAHQAILQTFPWSPVLTLILVFLRVTAL